MVELRGQLVTQWSNLHPDKAFPSPTNNPQMFPQNFVIKKTVYNYDYSWWDDLWGDCCAFSRCCSKGLIDYECQYNNSCYLNLINLGIHVIGVLLAIILLIILLGYAFRLAYKFVLSVAFITKFIECLGGCLKCFTFGVFDQKVYYKHQKPKAQYSEEEKRILKMTDDLDIKIIIPRLDNHKKQRLLQIFEDYEVVDDDQSCCGKSQNSKEVQYKNQREGRKSIHGKESFKNQKSTNSQK